MSVSILVGYASRSGSTQEVAEAIATTLHARGLAADCQPLGEVRALDGYTLVVIGAPLYMFQWHKDAKRFLARHRQALVARQVAVFALGPLHDDPQEWQEARGHLDKELQKSSWFAPVAIGVFGGKFDPAKLRFPYNLIPALRRMPASDIRDWGDISNWAIDVATKAASSPTV